MAAGRRARCRWALVVEQIRKLVGNGYREVVLTGVDITSYGPDLPGTPTLGKLVQQILRHVPDLPRLRISSIDSIEADEAFYDAIASDRRLMPHLHLSLQSGDDMILKRMKRRHSRAEALEVVAKLRALRPDMVFGADIIAGFPTETDEMFENTLADRHRGGAHLSPRLPVLAAPRHARRAHAAGRQARRAGAGRAAPGAGRDPVREARRRRASAMIESVLVEQDGIGRQEQFLPVTIPGQRQGELVPVRIVSTSPDGLVGEPIRSAA